MSTDDELNAIHSGDPDQLRDVLVRRATRESGHAALIALGLVYVGDVLRAGLEKLDKPRYVGPRGGAGSI